MIHKLIYAFHATIAVMTTVVVALPAMVALAVISGARNTWQAVEEIVSEEHDRLFK